MDQEYTGQGKICPAGFWVRLVAFIIDGIIISIIQFPLARIFPAPNHLQYSQFDSTTFTNMIARMLISAIVIFFYYGWFYKNKGASPGKMAMDLKVVDTDTGKNCGYVKTFFRETIGKFISGVIFAIGYLMVAFRKDKKALHDLLFNTKVLRED